MIVSTRKHISSDRIPYEYFQGDPALVSCWPLSENGIDIAGSNNLTFTNIIFTEGAARFNGTDSFGVTGGNVNLTSTNKITVIADVKCTPYNITSLSSIIESSVNPSVNNGSFAIIEGGTVAGDPLDIFIRGTGNVEFRYLLNKTPLADLNYHTIVLRGDFALTTDEVSCVIDGISYIADSKASNTNNAGNFGTYPIYFGMRAGTSNPFNGLMKNVILSKRFIGVEELADYQAWKNDIRRNNSVSFSTVMGIPLDKRVPASNYPKLVVNDSDGTGLVVADLSHGPDNNTIAEVRRMEKFNN